MTDISSDGRDAQGAPGGLDPELLQLFDLAPAGGSSAEAFIAAVMVRLRGARRRRLLARSSVTMLIIVSGALLAPYVAQVTLEIASRVTLYYPVACVCAALIAWRIARRPLN